MEAKWRSDDGRAGCEQGRQTGNDPEAQETNTLNTGKTKDRGDAD